MATRLIEISRPVFPEASRGGVSSGTQIREKVSGLSFVLAAFSVFVLFLLERVFTNSLVAICLKGENAYANALPGELISRSLSCETSHHASFVPCAVTSPRLPLQPPDGRGGSSGFPAGTVSDGRPPRTSRVSVIPRRRTIKVKDLSSPSPLIRGLLIRKKKDEEHQQ